MSQGTTHSCMSCSTTHSCSTTTSDISSTYQSDGEPQISFLAPSSNSSNTDFTDSGSWNNCEDVKARNTTGQFHFTFTGEEITTLRNLHLPDKPGNILLFPKSGEKYLEDKFPQLMNTILTFVEDIAAVVIISDSLRRTLGLSEHKRKPVTSMFDICIFCANFPTLLMSVTESPEQDDDVIYYNSKMSRELTGSIREHMVSNYNLVHGVIHPGTSMHELQLLVDDARREYSSQSLDMDGDTAAKIVRNVACSMSAMTESCTKSRSDSGIGYLEEDECQNGSLSGFVETAAYRTIREELKERSCITITGDPGSGKTEIALRLGLVYEKLGYRKIPLRSPTTFELQRHLHGEGNVFLILDDVFNNDTEVENIKQVLTYLENHIEQGECGAAGVERDIKIVLTARNYNFKFASIKGQRWLSQDSVVDISKIKRTSNEARVEARKLLMTLCKIHDCTLNEEVVSYISETDHHSILGFPLVSNLFIRNRNGHTCKDFIETVSLCNGRIFDSIIKSQNRVYTALLVVFLEEKNSDGIPDMTLDGMISHIKDIHPEAKETDILTAANKLEGIFVNCHSLFLSDLMYEQFTKSLYKRNPCWVVKHCKINFLTNVIESDSSPSDPKQRLLDRVCDSVAARFQQELFRGKFKVVFFSQLLQDENIVDKTLKDFQFQSSQKLHEEGKHVLFWVVSSDNAKLLPWLLDSFSNCHLRPGDIIEGVANESQMGLCELCLTLAIELKCMNIAAFLLNLDADVTQVYRQGQNILQLACRSNYFNMVKLVVNHCSRRFLSMTINTADEFNQSALALAAMNGNYEIFNFLSTIEDIMYVQKGDDTLLHLACDGGSVDIVDRVLSIYDYDINARDVSLLTPLMRAARADNSNIVHLLLSGNADPLLVDETGDTALHYACRHGSVVTVQCLIAKCDINMPDADGYTPAMLAAIRGKLDLFQFLVANKADVSIEGRSNKTIVHYACEGGNCEIVKLAVSDANINKADDQGRTPVMTAAVRGHVNVISLLISQGADVSVRDKDYNTILHLVEDLTLEVLVDIMRCVDINTRNKHTYTPLMAAALRGRTFLLKLIRENGGDQYAVDCKQNSIQHLACIGGNVQTVKAVMSKAAIEKCGELGRTPLLLAALNGHLGVVKLLKESYRADLDRKDDFGNMALHLACLSGSLELVDFLLPYVYIDARGQKKQTPLMMVAITGQTDLFKLLLSKGANHKLKDNKDFTCLELACKENRIDIVEHLFSKVTHDDKSKAALAENKSLYLAAQNGHKRLFFILLSNKGHEGRNALKDEHHLLLKACQGGCLEIVMYAQRHCRSQFNWRGTHCTTPLMSAAEMGHGDVFHFLLQEGYDKYISVEDKKGNTLLHLACEGGNKDIVSTILEYNQGKQMVNRRNTSAGMTPLMVCLKSSRFKHNIFEMLVRCDCDLGVKDKDGNSYLHWAVWSRQVKCVKYLLEKGLDKDLKNKLRKTPHTQSQFHDKDIRELFDNQNSDIVIGHFV